MEDFIEDDGESYDFYEMDKSPVDGNQSSGFECNICLDLVQDPVVTLCGHLYCWACIYKWLDSPNVSIENSQQEHPCPVCKAEISHTALIPLYGRGQSARNTKSKTRHLGIVIPRRPLGPTFGIDSPILGSTTPSPILHQQPYSPSYLPHSQYDPTPSMVSLSSTTTTSIVDPIVGIFGEMVFAMVSGNSEANLYPYPNSYHLENMSPRVRRRMMQVNRSLSRICFFLLCCSILCLLLF